MTNRTEKPQSLSPLTYSTAQQGIQDVETSTVGSERPLELTGSTDALVASSNAASRRKPLRPGTRPEVWGKFIFADDSKFYIKGVTYGPFRPDESKSEYYDPERVRADFEQLVDLGCNSIRTYTVPPVWLLDIAAELGLRVMIGLPWEQHITFLDDKQRRNRIEDFVRTEVRRLRDHPAVLCYAIGNEIPASIVRWYGARRVQKFLNRLYEIAKQEDPTALVTYVNYPTTEYLDVPGDFCCFNVYLESTEQLERYIARIHNLSGDRPVVIAELGLDSIRNGEEKQAALLQTQIANVFASGCSGVFTFAFTDEWFRGGVDILDWGFGLTTRDRVRKPAFDSVRDAFARVPFAGNSAWPRISVVVCTYNGSRTLDRCCSELMQLDYPDYEVIVVDDGSTDNVREIASRHNVRLISTENRGLSSARNTGANAATGEIVAYIDDDAWPDTHWLRYIALTLTSGKWAGVGGPNLPPTSDGGIADCVANAPGGPIHVLLTDQEAEHIPGCNMAFLKSALDGVKGLDPSFRVAGDDVDLCWRIQENGGVLGFNPAAVVWHHRRGSVRGFLRQQWAYGKAEAMLERKWPERYNLAGHLSWRGRIYADHLVQLLQPARQRIYHGYWGTAPFQSVYQAGPSGLATLVTLPEWYLVTASLAVLSVLGFFWQPLFIAVPLLMLTLGASVTQSILGASHASFPTQLDSRWRRFKRYVLTAVLHFCQPIARLLGRFHWGLTPWRHRASGWALPGTRETSYWSEQWRDPSEWLENVEQGVLGTRAVVRRGGDFDAWDLVVSHGFFQDSTVTSAVEEHGSGRQLFRLRIQSRISPAAAGGFMLAAGVGMIAFAAGANVPAVILVIAAGAIALRIMQEVSTSLRAIDDSAKAAVNVQAPSGG